MPVRPKPVRYICTRCKHDWVWAPRSDVLIEPPGICPRCGGSSTPAGSASPARQLLQSLSDLLSRRG